jgi:N-acetylmuramoyl-L-alanine amidase
MRGLGVLVSAVLLQGSVTAVAAQPVAIDVGHFLARPGAISAYGVTEFEYNHALAAVIAARLAGAGVPVRLIGHRGEMADLRARPRRPRRRGRLLPVHPPRFGEGGIPAAVDLERPRAAYAEGHAPVFRCSCRGSTRGWPKAWPAPAPSARPCAGPACRWRPTMRVLGRCGGTAVGRRGQRGVFLRQPGGAQDATVPAVLLEAGVIVHPDEARELATAGRRDLAAAAVESGLRACGVIAP